MLLNEMTHDNTQQYIGDTFRIEFTDGRVIELKLERIDLLLEKHAHPKMKRDAFALIFRGPRDPMLQQHIFPLQHKSLGVLELFLVPIAMDEPGALYEAVFN